MRAKEFRVIKGEKCWECCRCERWRSESEFHRDKRKLNGLDSRCRECRPIVAAEYYRRRNKEAERVTSNKWRAANRKKVRRLDRERYQRHRDEIKADRKEYRRKNPEKIKAQLAVNHAVRSGKLRRPAYCEICGARSEHIEGHHDSYDRDRWLVVTWLCSSCHKFLHTQRRRRQLRLEEVNYESS